jgi:glycosyltransferase involved in cell wall biosynthesis
MIKLLKPKITVYDCPDAVVFKNNKKQRLYDRLKKMTLQESTVSFFTSKPLLEEGKKYSENSFYIPNGVDVETFVQKKYETPEIIDTIPGPILGLVGTFDERLDIDLLDFILENIPKATLVMVGPVQMKLGNLGKSRRLILTGKKDYEKIPSFINKFDVALIPYLVNEVTECIYPVKLHEYLILGKPIVSTDLPEVRQFSDVVLIARSKEEFVRQVVHALKDNDEIKIRKRIGVAENNSWEKRISEISKKIQPYLR